MSKLAVIALGRPNAGKSSTWYQLFGRTIRTGWKTLELASPEQAFVQNSSFEETGKVISEEVFVRNASFEESGNEIEDYFNKDEGLPYLVFCSVQYIEKGKRTIKWFVDHGYQLYIQWINPGFRDTQDRVDYLDFEDTFRRYGRFEKRSGKEITERVEEIRSFVTKWIDNNK